MKSHRSAFLSVALGLAMLGTAACEDKTEVIIPDPSDPISVNLVPDAITLEVGETADFAAVVTGGDEDTPRTVTFSSGNAAVATVSGTGTVTAVGTGTTTITATATADPSAVDVSTITVVAEGTGDPAPPTVSIQSITQFATTIPVNINNAFGQLDVTLNVDVPPGNDVSSVQVLVEDVATGNEMAVCTQSFSGGDASLSTDAAAQVEIVCSFDSAEWDMTTGAVTHLNGPKILRARLVAPDGEILATVETQIIFNNQNFISAQVSGSNGTAISANGPQSVATPGLLWYGGAITVNMISVNYNPAGQGPDQNLSSATVTLTSSGSGVTGLAGCTTTGNLATDPTIGPAQGGAGAGAPIVTGVNAGGFVFGPVSASLPGCAAATTTQTNTTIAGGAVFSVTFPTTASMAAGGVANVEDAFLLAITSVTVGGQPGPACINPNPVNNPQNLGCPTAAAAPNAGLANPVNVDNLAPRVPQLNIVRPSQYFSFQVPSHAITATGAACTAPCARTVDYGVDRQAEAGNAVFNAGLTTGSMVDVTAGLGILAETAASSGATAYLFQLVITDALGNTRTVFAGPTATIVATSTTALRFGIDQTLPTQTTVGMPDNWVNPESTLNPAAGANCSVSGVGCNTWVVSFIDTGNPATGGGPSGFNANPVMVRLERVTPAGTTCYNPNNTPATLLATCATIADDGIVTPPIAGTDGYWRVTVTVVDAAGNTSDPATTVLILSDHTAPSFTGGVVAPSVIAGGSSVPFNAAITDNVDLGDLLPYVEFNFGGTAGVDWFAFMRTMIGSFGPDNIVASDPGNVTIDGFPRSIETTTAAGLPTGTVLGVTGMFYQIRDVAGFTLMYNQTPWQAPADPDAGDCPPAGGAHPASAATQNCSLRSINIQPNSLAGMPTPGVLVGTQYGALVTANGVNALYGLFAMQPPSNAIICNNTPRAGCAANRPTTTTLTVTVTGQNAVFLTPFTAVKFYRRNLITNVWELIGETSAPSVTDNTVLQLRTYTYTQTWDATNLKVRPAAGGTVYPVVAVGTNATGDWLISTTATVTVEGN